LMRRFHAPSEAVLVSTQTLADELAERDRTHLVARDRCGLVPPRSCTASQVGFAATPDHAQCRSRRGRRT
jgi:hypothetical protein